MAQMASNGTCMPSVITAAEARSGPTTSLRGPQQASLTAIIISQMKKKKRGGGGDGREWKISGKGKSKSYPMSLGWKRTGHPESTEYQSLTLIMFTFITFMFFFTSTCLWPRYCILQQLNAGKGLGEIILYAKMALPYLFFFLNSLWTKIKSKMKNCNSLKHL